MLSMEEGVSFWRVSLMWRAYLSCLMAYVVVVIFLSIIEGVPGMLCFNSSKRCYIFFLTIQYDTVCKISFGNELHFIAIFRAHNI